jgi:hypothetical protein
MTQGRRVQQLDHGHGTEYGDDHWQRHDEGAGGFHRQQNTLKGARAIVANATAMPTNAKWAGGGISAAGSIMPIRAPYVAPLSAPSNKTGVK